MPGTVALSDLVTRVRRRADMENSTFCSDLEIQEYIEQSYGALYDLMIASGAGEMIATQTQAHTTVANTAEYTIYDDGDGASDVAKVYKIIKVTAQFDGKYRPIKPGQLHDYFSHADRDGQWSDRRDVRYVSLLVSDDGLASSAPFERNIAFYPTPPAGYSFKVFYIPYPIDWSDNSAYVMQGYSGWEEYVVCDAAAKCLEKEESDPTFLLTRRDQAAQRVLRHMATMNHDYAGKVRNIDIEHGNYWYNER